jgi:hypothetical protein
LAYLLLVVALWKAGGQTLTVKPLFLALFGGLFDQVIFDNIEEELQSPNHSRLNNTSDSMSTESDSARVLRPTLKHNQPADRFIGSIIHKS